MDSRRLPSFIFVGMLLISATFLGYGSEAFLGGTFDHPGSAVDAKGIRHTEPAKSGRIPPWMQDRVKLLTPIYPYEDRRLHHTGLGWFHIDIDLKTGLVSQITILKSTGFATLDNSAVVAFRQSRWKPRTWKEIDVPVNFVLDREPSPSPVGAVHLPPH